ncbi:ATP-binding protein [Pseudobutyrivibrio xylanivorans]|uniref:CO dehydrogenase maturation factor n=1 Tax=Pseudobutyrivibrio xylanivorans DSM 14809 TaxID=1123012 RepID=A0A1M6A9E9_PSEXY|nr:AAA family ATPase [Pseudobutyrivibrio xylanivorans]SHI33154.1 CO dehydrogenase maturation factor [Pseudobutyrivibrio xylanivorans DSM 14809]
MEKKPIVLAVAGKGGVGKTSLASVMVKLLVEAYPDKKILAIDADPAVGLSTALGVEPELTLDDIRKEAVEAAENGDAKATVEVLGEARYRIFDAMVEMDGFSFIAIGRPEAAGCYCKINTYLKEVISQVADNFDYIVIDGEAGIEQINRRVMEKVTHLVLITDSSKKGCGVVKTIKEVADNLVMYDKIGVVVNRVPSEDVLQFMDLGDIPLLGWIPADANLTERDLKGESVFYIPSEAPIVEGLRSSLKKMGVL